MAREYKSEFNTTGPKGDGKSDELIDKDINFENRNMHGSWPFIKGCLTLIGIVSAFIIISTWVFRNWSNWF